VEVRGAAAIEAPIVHQPGGAAHHAQRPLQRWPRKDWSHGELCRYGHGSLLSSRSSAVAKFCIPVLPEMTQPRIVSRRPISSSSPQSDTSDDFEELAASAFLASPARQRRVQSAAQQAVLPVGRISRVHWRHPRNGRTSLCYQVAVPGKPENVAIASFDNNSSTCANGAERLQHYWGTQ
jgi:hypothetical protein